MVGYVLGAPGSGKSLIVPRLRRLLPDRVVLDWDALMGPAGDLAGAPIPQTPRTWEPYGRLVRAVADLVLPADLLVLGVCTPEEMAGWPQGPWILLDCADDVRRERLSRRGEPDDVEEALADAARYRTLGLDVVDSTALAPDEVARAVVDQLTGPPCGCPDDRGGRAPPVPRTRLAAFRQEYRAELAWSDPVRGALAELGGAPSPMHQTPPLREPSSTSGRHGVRRPANRPWTRWQARSNSAVVRWCAHQARLL